MTSDHMKYLLIASLLTLSNGCSYFVSWEDLSANYINRPVFEFEQWQNPDSVEELIDGNFEYKYHLYEVDPSCFHYWIVDKNKVIQDFRYTGRCRPVG